MSKHHLIRDGTFSVLVLCTVGLDTNGNLKVMGLSRESASPGELSLSSFESTSVDIDDISSTSD